MSIDSSKLVVKLYVDAAATDVKLAEVVPVFHSWIQTQAVRDHLLIDVADYAHVPDGPGTVLVAHEANIYLDELDGRLGLTYSRKLPLPGTFADRLQYVVRIVRETAALLAGNPALVGRIKFKTDEMSFRINDRLLGPNTPQTFEAVRGDLERVWGKATLEPRLDEKRLFEVRVNPAHSR
jgi:hypothetical protein